MRPPPWKSSVAGIVVPGATREALATESSSAASLAVAGVRRAGSGRERGVEVEREQHQVLEVDRLVRRRARIDREVGRRADIEVGERRHGRSGQAIVRAQQGEVCGVDDVVARPRRGHVRHVAEQVTERAGGAVRRGGDVVARAPDECHVVVEVARRRLVRARRRQGRGDPRRPRRVRRNRRKAAARVVVGGIAAERGAVHLDRRPGRRRRPGELDPGRAVGVVAGLDGRRHQVVIAAIETSDTVRVIGASTFATPSLTRTANA
jgi:hypothetical protein